MGVSPLESILDRAISRGDPALWHRHDGAWTPGGDAPGRDIRELAAALVHYGVGGGRSVLVLGSEGPDTSRAGLAVLAAGGCLVRLEATAPDALLLRALEEPQVALAIVEDDRQLRRVLALRPDLPQLEMVILLSGEQSERKAAALLVGAVVDVGAALLQDDPGLLGRARAGLPGSVPALLVPVGGELRALSRQGLAAAADRLTDEVSFGPGRTVLVMLPSDVIETVAVVLGALARGATVLAVVDAEHLGRGLREKAPDGAVVSPRALTGLHAEWIDELEGRSWLVRSLLRWGLNEGADPARHPRRHRVAELIVLRRIRGRWGGRLRAWGVVGGPVSSEISGFFASTGLPLYVMPGVATVAVAH